MEVMVFIAKAVDNDGRTPTLLALPAAADAAIPRHLQAMEWSYYAQMDATDVSLGGPGAGIADRVAREGYAEVPFRLSSGR